MLVLPRYYRFKIYNNSGVSISANNAKVYTRRFKFGADGALSYENSETLVLDNSSSISPGSYDAATMVDNNTDKYIGGTFVFQVTLTGSPNGNVVLFFERSTDGTTRVDSDGVGDVVAVLNFTSATTKRKSFSL
jgi:hypothetical protein